MKLFIFLFICLIFNNILPSSQNLIESVELVAKDIITQVTGQVPPVGSNSCTNDIFTCIIDDINPDIEYVVKIHLNQFTSIVSVTANFTVFAPHLEYLGCHQVLVPDIWSHVPYLTNLVTLAIYNQTTPIPTTSSLPNSLDSFSIYNLNVELPPFIFSANVNEMHIIIGNKGYGLPTSTIPTNNKLTILRLPLNQYAPVIPTSLTNSLEAVKDFSLFINNAITTNYVNYDFPILTNFKSLTGLTFIFENDGTNYQKWVFPTYITELKKLIAFGVDGKGLTLDTNGQFIDFTKLSDACYLYFKNNPDFIVDCQVSPCLRLPTNSALELVDTSVNISLFDLSNANSINMRNNQLSQKLPSDNYDMMVEAMVFKNSSFTGPLPDKFCFTKYIAISYNLLSGDVPTCLSCTGGAYFGNQVMDLFPNQFNDFNPTSAPTSCPTFKIVEDYNKLAKTDGSTIVTIIGYDFGWAWSDQSNSNLELNITIPNKELTLKVPKGVGLNAQVPVKFHTNRNYAFTFNYELPIITGYSWWIDEGNPILIIKGTGFDFSSFNNFSINGVSYLAASAVANDDCYGCSYFSTGFNPLVSSSAGQTFTIFVNVGGQISDTVTFTLFNSINITGTSNDLLKEGGIVTLIGEFGTSDTSLVKITINNIQCTVISVSPTELKINYPSNEVGTHPLNLNIGGYAFNTDIDYIDSNASSSSTAPTTSSSTTSPTTTSPTTTSPTTSPSSDDDTPSTLSKISISFFLILPSLIIMCVF